jgi:aspartate kinase
MCGGDAVLKIVVQKFGGSSVATAPLRENAIRHVSRAMGEGLRPVVVVSAMGRKGDPYATDTLVGLAREAGDSDGSRELDLLMSCGEVVSAAIMALTMKRKGLPAVALTGAQAGITTDNQFGEARVLWVSTDRLLRELEDGNIPVITGFQGITTNGDITTLGRGASDTSAAVVGVALGAELVEIFTDVDGVKTADPRVVPQAVTLERMTYSEVVEMALLGARVVHPRAVQIAREGRVPLKIRCTAGDGSGTLITDGRVPGRNGEVTNDRLVVGIAHVPGRAQIRLDMTAATQEAVPAAFFQALGDAGISVDMIGVSPSQLRVTIASSHVEMARGVLGRLSLPVEIVPGFAKVSVVGAGMHGVPGVMARVAGALASVGVLIYQSTDSHANISCLVREEEAALAIATLHSEFQLHVVGSDR